MNCETINPFAIIAIMLFISQSFSFILNIIGVIQEVEFEIKYLETYHNHGCAGVTNVMYDEGKRIYGDEFLDFVKDKLTEYSVNTDTITRDHLNYMYTCLYNKEKKGYCCPADFYYLNRARQQYAHDSSNGVLNKFIVNPKFDEIFVDYHGMRYARPEVKDYIKNKDIIDVGAYIGDSAIVLSQFTNRKIYSYDIVPTNMRKLNENIIANHLEGKIEPNNMGLGMENNSVMYLNSDFESTGLSVGKYGRIPVNMSTIDAEVESRNLIPGMIKADIEGSELNLLKGANGTIAKYRPILSISAYHNFDGLFRIPDFIKSFGNYKLYFRACSHAAAHMGEVIMVAIPAEIGDFVSYETDDNPLTTGNFS